ncbi:MAG: hypothetical protein LUE24_14530 [Lachnospiraceae bacterium]|nr:hypothetical protein [Lachnospiraceae bacterium]
MTNEALKKFTERKQRVDTAAALGTPDRVPFVPMFNAYLLNANGSCFKDALYDQEKAADAAIKFYKEHPLCDMHTLIGCYSGKAQELSGNQILDWPGRPGTKVSDYSIYQVKEQEFMKQEEYPEMLNDWTGFMLRKYIPRLYPNLKGLSNINFLPAVMTLTNYAIPCLCDQEILETYRLLLEIAAEDAKANAAFGRYNQEVTDLGVPGMCTGISGAPYDILGDYFRGTMGLFEDLTDEDMQEYMERACDMFANQQIQALQYYKYVDVPVRQVFFPLRKGVDGFMNAEQYERLYWKPLKKIIMALIDMNVTPFIFCEGSYKSRLEQLTDVPKGKVIYLFENVDMKEAKRIFDGKACIMGNLPISMLTYAKKEDVVTATRKLLDDCMPGGGYIFSFGGEIDDALPENVDAVFETIEKYGKY